MDLHGIFFRLPGDAFFFLLFIGIDCDIVSSQDHLPVDLHIHRSGFHNAVCRHAACQVDIVVRVNDLIIFDHRSFRRCFFFCLFFRRGLFLRIGLIDDLRSGGRFFRGRCLFRSRCLFRHNLFAADKEFIVGTYKQIKRVHLCFKMDIVPFCYSSVFPLSFLCVVCIGINPDRSFFLKSLGDLAGADPDGNGLIRCRNKLSALRIIDRDDISIEPHYIVCVVFQKFDHICRG